MKLSCALLLASLIASAALGQTTDVNKSVEKSVTDSLFQAIAQGDASRVSMTLAEANPNARDAQGNTALMVATKLGNFEVIRQLLWSGGDPRLKNAQGQTATDFINPSNRNAQPNELMLRCYAFTLSEAKPNKSPLRNPHRTIVSDGFVEPNHPLYGKRFIRNLAELNGKPGVDDDKNGFIDDIDGWNVINDQPAEVPKMGITADPANRKVIAEILKLREITLLSKSQKERNLARFKLKNSYTNPLVKMVGSEIYQVAGLDLNDDAYALMFGQASHGNHVAGIIHKASHGKAELACSNIFNLDSPADHPCQDPFVLYSSAKSSPDFKTFLEKILNAERRLSVKRGKRASQYLQFHSAGVVNMSWARPALVGTANNLITYYRNNGDNPSSIGEFFKKGPIKNATHIGLELKIANSASFAIVFAENPNVLFTIAAGNVASKNSVRNNDVSLVSPPYLSSFFPNVITVASHDDNDSLSSFSFYGKRSVQIAAPGRNIQSSLLAGFHGPMTGTSMAAPYVAGIAAKLRAENPKLTAREIRNIIENSADPIPTHQYLTSTGGKINPVKAALMAKTTAGSNFAIASAAQKPRVSLNPSTPAFRGKFAIRNIPHRITSLASVRDTWTVVMSKSPSPAPQQVSITSAAPDVPYLKSLIGQQGYHISNVGGDREAWAVVLAKGPSPPQNIAWNVTDFNLIAANKAKGLGIADIAGTTSGWMVLFEPLENFGDQRYTAPTPLNKSRIEWLKARLSEGYAITSLAGNDQISDDSDGWVFVMSKKSPFRAQAISMPGPWPAKWIQNWQNKGYRITDIAGTKGSYVVVMSTSSTLESQNTIRGRLNHGFPKSEVLKSGSP